MSGDQYGNGYGNDPQYPTASYTQPPASGAPTPSNQRPLLIALGAVVVAGLVVLVLAVSGVFGGGGSGPSPTVGAKAAVEKVLYASKRQNLDDVKATVCKKDLSDPELADIVGDEHAISYSIGEAKEDGPDRVTVSVKVSTAKNDSDSADLPVIREDGAWKVCFSEVGHNSSSSASTPDPTRTESSSESSSDDTDFNICASRTDAASTAKVFISFITLGSADQAADCIADGKVSESQLKALLGDVYSPSQDAGAGPQFTFKSVSGSSTITLTVEKQSDGRFYVTAASKS